MTFESSFMLLNDGSVTIGLSLQSKIHANNIQAKTVMMQVDSNEPKKHSFNKIAKYHQHE